MIPDETRMTCSLVKSGQCDHVRERCPACQGGWLVERKNGRDGTPFIGCSRYRKDLDRTCRYTRKFPEQRAASPVRPVGRR